MVDHCIRDLEDGHRRVWAKVSSVSFTSGSGNVNGDVSIRQRVHGIVVRERTAGTEPKSKFF